MTTPDPLLSKTETRASSPDRARTGEPASSPSNGFAANTRPAHHSADAPLSNASRPDVVANATLLNRDLSWLEFNRRVLKLSMDARTPLLERVRFLSIFSSNLDEFCMKRLGLLDRRVEADQRSPDLDGLNPGVLLLALRASIRELQQMQIECYEHHVKPALAREGIELVDYAVLDAPERTWLRRWFRACAFPVLTPLAVDPGHRFPFISNLSRNFGVLLAEPGVVSTSKVEPLFARLKIPSIIPQWVRVPEDTASEPLHPKPLPGGLRAPVTRGRFVGIADIIHANLDDLFPGMQLLEVVPFRVTRDTESALTDNPDDDTDNLLEMVEAQLRKRRFASPVRLEVGLSPSPNILHNLAHELELTPADIDELGGPLDYTTLAEIIDLDRPDLKWPKWTPIIPTRLSDKNRSIFDVVREGDLLVHHPFESFEGSAQRFIHEAARDPNVVAIKQTIYRTSKDSPFVQSLIRAAEAGKQVAVLVELRARFDEQANVRLARMLEKAGAHVAYGVIGLKTHCKAAMVVRREHDGLRTYAHLGTGNYHPRTAMLYTDLGLFTTDPAIIDDVTELFNFLTGRSRLDTYETLLIAPINMKPRFIAMIKREIEQAKRFARGESPVGGRIVAKMNAFADNEVAEQLYIASKAGVQITLFIRGFCCLRPGVAGLSENIRVVSVVGRFLEHSRVFHFGAGKLDPLEGDWYISSADWMYRNLNNRVEAATPVTSKSARAKLLRILQIMNADRRGAWQLQSDGAYARLEPTPEEASDPDSPAMLGTFSTLMREAQFA